jgi:hypothetical protein
MAKKKQIKNKLVKITFIHFDSEGKMTQLDDLKNINWIENGAKFNCNISKESRGTK